LPQVEQFACANWWKTSWEKNGWDCVMLNKSHVGASNLHTKLVSKLAKLLHTLPDNLLQYYPQLVARYLRQENCAAAIHKFISEEFIIDGLLKIESDILNIKDRLSAIGDKVRHIDKSDILKSEVMASLM